MKGSSEHEIGRGGEGERPVYRTRPLPKGELQGNYFLPRQLLAKTRKALVSIALDGIRDGGHEGLVYWAGREVGDAVAFLSVIVPQSDHGPQHVMVSGPEVNRSARRARDFKLGILAQVHSHPDSDARHSDGDDDLVLMPFEGMLSVVAPHHGREVVSLSDLVVHQYQDGQWVWCSPESVKRGFETVPPVCDLR